MKRKFRFSNGTIQRLRDFLRRREDEPAQAEAAPEKPVFAVHALTDVGKVRASNQDALVVDEGLMLFGVADGMGGHNGLRRGKGQPDRPAGGEGALPGRAAQGHHRDQRRPLPPAGRGRKPRRHGHHALRCVDE